MTIPDVPEAGTLPWLDRYAEMGGQILAEIGCTPLQIREFGRAWETFSWPILAEAVGDVETLRAEEYDRGRREAAEAIAAHRDKFWPKDERLDSARARVRRHLNIAIQVANPPSGTTPAAALKALVDQMMAPSTPATQNADLDPPRVGPFAAQGYGCPKCGSILNAQVANCDGEWHADNLTTAAAWREAEPGDTPGQVEPDDAQPQPVDLHAHAVERQGSG